MAEGNTGEQHTCRIPSRESVSRGLNVYESLQSRRLRQQLMIIIPESAPHEALSLCDNTSKSLESPHHTGFLVKFY